VLFAVREVPTESLGFSPNELVFGHRVRGPLAVVREAWSGEEQSSESLLSYVTRTRERLLKGLEMARSDLVSGQARMKAHYDRKAQCRSFKVGDEVLVLLPLQGKPLSAKFSGPYEVTRRIGELDYLVRTPDRRKKHQLCHVNMLKPYYRVVPSSTGPVCAVSVVSPVEEEEEEVHAELVSSDLWESNSCEVLRDKLRHLPVERQEELYGRLMQFPQVFGDSPGLTSWAEHDIDVADSAPVKLPPYRVNC